MNNPSIVIENVHVRSIEYGTYNLNDMHRAAIAGGLAKKWQVPSQFLGADGVQAFVDEVSKVLKDTLEQNQILDVVHGGSHRGTWAHELIALKYAAWLSASFEVKVYQTFRDVVMGKLSLFAEANKLELEYQHKTKRVSTAARIMNRWGSVAKSAVLNLNGFTCRSRSNWSFPDCRKKMKQHSRLKIELADLNVRREPLSQRLSAQGAF